MSETTTTQATPTEAQASPVIAPTPSGGGARDWLPEAYRNEAVFANFKDVNDLAASHLSAAKMVGMDKGRVAVIPKDEADANGWNDVYNKLGRPEKAADYGLKGEGPDGPLWEAAQSVFHDAGLSKKQAAALHGFVGQISAQQMESFSKQPEQAVQAFMPRIAQALTSEAFADQTVAKLKGEWGQAFDQNMHAAGRAKMALAAGDPEIAAMFEPPEKGGLGLINLPGMVKLMAAIGAKISEPTGLAGVGGGVQMGAMSPTDAMKAISAMTADRAFGQKLLAGDAEATAKWKAANDALAG